MPGKSKLAPTLAIPGLVRFLPTLWKQPPYALIQLREKYGDIVRLGFASKTILHLLSHPEYIQHVLLDNHRNYKKKSLYHNHLFRFLLGQGLLNSEGELWLRQRRMIQPAFHHERLAPLVSIMASEVEKMLGQWNGYYQRGEPIDIYQEMVDLTRRINGRIIFGNDIVGDIVAKGRRIFSKGARFLLVTGNRIPTKQRHNFLTIQKIFDEAIWRVINDRVAKPNDNDDLLNMLLQARDRKTGEPMPLPQLRDELVTFIFAGYETTEKSLTWCWYLLSQNPAQERRLHQELMHTLGGRVPAFDDLPNLDYSRRVAQEALRLFPPAWVMGREAIKDDEIGGYHIPAGSYVIINQFGLHRHPDFWDAPDTFNPDRFLPENATDRPRFAFNPFGGGPRQCIGNELALMETQIVISMVAQHYSPHLLPDHPVELEPEVTLKPRYGLQVMLEKPQFHALPDSNHTQPP